MLAGVRVEHELRQCALHARDRARQHGEARRGETRARLEIDAAQQLTEVDVVTRLEVERARLAPAPDLDVVVLAGAVGHRVVGQVGQAEHERLEFALDRLQAFLARLELLAELGDRLAFRLDVLAPRLGRANRLAAPVALGLQALGLGLQ